MIVNYTNSNNDLDNKYIKIRSPNNTDTYTLGDSSVGLTFTIDNNKCNEIGYYNNNNEISLYSDTNDINVNYLYTRSFYQDMTGIKPVPNITKNGFSEGTDTIYGVNVAESYRGISSWNSKVIVKNTKEFYVRENK